MVIVQVENDDSLTNGFVSDSSLDDDEPLHKVAQSLSLKRNKTIKYRENNSIKEIIGCKNMQLDHYKPIDQVRNGNRFNTLPSPPSTPVWVKRPVSLVHSESVSSIDSIDNCFDNLEEKFSHSIQNIPIMVPSIVNKENRLDRAQAVAFLKSKSEQRSGISRGKKLERIPTNDL